MTTTDFHDAEAPAGAGAGGTIPRRLIPSRFRRTAATGEPEHWTGSLLRVAMVLVISAAAGIGVSLILGHGRDRPEVLAPVNLPAPSGNGHHGRDLIRGAADATDPLPRSWTGSELFE